MVVLNSEEVCGTLSTQRKSLDNSIRSDAKVIWYEFDMSAVRRFIGIHGRENLGDPGCKPSSPLPDAGHLLLVTTNLTFSPSAVLSASARNRS